MIRMLTILAALLAPGAAWATDCRQAPLRVEQARVVVEYDPFADEDVEQRLRIVAPDGVCDDDLSVAILARSGVTEAPRGFVFPGGLQFDIVDESRRSVSGEGRDGGAAVRAGRGRGPGRADDLTLKVTARRGQVYPPGPYVAGLTLQTRGKRGRVIGEDRFELELRVRPSVRVSSSTLLVDLGLLTDRLERNLQLTAFANTRYRLELTSDYGWRLLPLMTRNDAGVPYSVTLNGAPLAVSGPTALVVRDAPSRGVDPMQVGVQIGAVEGRPAGDYRDYITVAIAPAP